MNTILLAAALGALTPATVAQPIVEEGNWVEDFDEAAAIAKEQGKDLFVDFTGSDWCIWCIRLHDEVFVHDEFLSYIEEDYVLVKLDFPRDPEIPVPNPERNRELANLYDISGYPTVLLMTADGDVFGQTGYQQGGPEPYVEHLKELRAEGREALSEVVAFLEKFDAAEGDAKLELLDSAIGRLEALGDNPALARKLNAPVKWALEADADNERGLKLRAVKALVSAGQMDDDVLAAANELDPDNAEGLKERVVEAQFMSVMNDEDAKAACDSLAGLLEDGVHDQDVGFQLCFTAARWCSSPNLLDDAERAATFAKAALEFGSDDLNAVNFLEDLIAEGDEGDEG